MSYAPQKLDGSTLADRAYQELRSAIVAGDLRPGEKITDRGLADLLAVSPTPVREAVRRLEQDRLVHRISPRVVQVATYAPQERAEINEIEISLLVLAARLAAEKATEEQIADLQRVLDLADRAREAMHEAFERDPDSTDVRLHADELIGALRRFHRGVNEACGNEMLLHMLSMVEAFSLRERQRILQQQLADQAPPPQERYSQHWEILDALRKHDPERASELMEAHSRHARRDLLDRA